MIKTIGKAWKAHTPKILHPYTKENIIFQLTLAGAFIAVMEYRDWREQRQINRERDNNVFHLQEYAEQR